ncbi:MAG: YfjI family protein [Blastocatellia bacterium]
MIDTYPYPAIWRAHDGDTPVTVIGDLGAAVDGRRYLRVVETDTGIPADEVRRPDAYRVSLFSSKRDALPQEAARTWAELLDRFAHPAIRAGKDGPLFSPAIFDPPKRAKENARELSLLVLDFDSGLEIEDGLRPWRALGLRCAYHTTHSHLRVTPDHPDAQPRYRVVIPLADPIPASEFPALWRWAAEQSGGEIDRVCRDVSRIYYAPAKASKDAHYEWGDFDGALLDWRALDPRDRPVATAKANQNGQRADSYARAALAGEVARVRDAPNGARNDAVNKAAFALGQLVGAGALSAGEVELSLLGAAVGAGLPESEARRTIRSGLAAGEKEPRASFAGARKTATNGSGERSGEPETSGQNANADWELPAEFNSYVLPNFPVEYLPEWLRAHSTELARETQTPIDLAAILGLANCAAAIAGKYMINARAGWIEPANIFFVCVLPVGNRKTAVYDATTAPLAQFEREIIKEMQPVIDEKRLEKEALEERIKHLKTAAGKCDNKAERDTKLAEMKVIAEELRALKVPAIPKLIVSGDITPESIGSHLAEQDGRLFLSSDEGELFELLSGRYSSGTPNFEIILKAHTGGTIRVDRRQRSEIVEKASLTIALTVQPDVLRGLVTKPQFRGRGLLGRFLYSLPASTVGSRKPNAEPMSEGTAKLYSRKVRALAGIARPEGCYHSVALAADAQTALVAFLAEVEKQLPEDAPMGGLADWGTKLAGAVVRIAGVLHLAEWAGRRQEMPSEIPVRTFNQAAGIGRYFRAHAMAAYAEMGADPEIEAAKYVLRFIEKAGVEEITKREIFEKTKGRFKKVDALEPALKVLEAHNYIRPLARATEPGKAGRKASQLYEINPHRSTAYNSHNSQNEVEKEDSANCANCAPKTDSGEFGLVDFNLPADNPEESPGIAPPDWPDWAAENVPDDAQQAREVGEI